MNNCVGDVKGVIVLDNEGQRIIAKYYNTRGTIFDAISQQKNFEKQIFYKSSKQSASGRSASEASRVIN